MHTVSLKIAKKLKEAGWEQEVSFWWAEAPPDTMWLVGSPWCVEDWSDDKHLLLLLWDDVQQMSKEEDEHFMSPESAKFYPAPTLTELLEALPKGVRLSKGMVYGNYAFTTWEEEEMRMSVPNERWNKNPADAAALLWTALKEKGIIV